MRGGDEGGFCGGVGFWVGEGLEQWGWGLHTTARNQCRINILQSRIPPPQLLLHFFLYLTILIYLVVNDMMRRYMEV